ncbi:hypothetical protein GGGNBK_02520 [Sporosarcina sp. ANT_H38]
MVSITHFEFALFYILSLLFIRSAKSLSVVCLKVVYLDELSFMYLILKLSRLLIN